MVHNRIVRVIALVMAVIIGWGGAAHASEVDVTSVVDVTAPTTSVTLAPGGPGGAITINLSVTGNHAGTATFEVYRDWNLSGGQFTGSNPQEFTVPLRAGGDPATTFSASGMVTVASGQANGTFALTVGAFDITNSNTTGGKMAAGDSATYSVTVQASTPTDTNGPVVTCTPSASDGVWHATNQSVSCGATDSSGLSSSTPTPQTLSTNVASGEENANAQTGTYTFCDTLNNCTIAGPIAGWKIDRKGPTGITFSGAPTTVTLGSTFPVVTCSATDGGSGLASCAVTGQGSSSIGTYNLTGTATDNVGNQSSATHSYSVIYDWDGFYAPIDNRETDLNRAKAGSAIPVKFSLAGDHGLSIMETGFPKATQITCPTGANVDPLEELATGTTSGLKYDQTADQYNYTWKTTSTYAGKCYRLDVKLIDGTVHSAKFQFTK